VSVRASRGCLAVQDLLEPRRICFPALNPCRFVVKTQDMATGHKVFLNMCGHPRVAAPGNWAAGTIPESVQNALDNVDNLSEAEVNICGRRGQNGLLGCAERMCR